MKSRTKYSAPPPPAESGEFLWLISLSDLMILLFILFVVLFSASYKKMSRSDVEQLVNALHNKKQPKSPLEDVAANVAKFVEDAKLQGEVAVKRTEDAVLIDIKDRVLFRSGEFELNQEGANLARQISSLLGRVPPGYRIGIEGHTDDVPVRGNRIHDNWDLAGKRAHSVLEALQLPASLLRRAVVMSYGEMQPVLPNRDRSGQPLPENRSRNRRVTLRIF